MQDYEFDKKMRDLKNSIVKALTIGPDDDGIEQQEQGDDDDDDGVAVVSTAPSVQDQRAYFRGWLKQFGSVIFKSC